MPNALSLIAHTSQPHVSQGMIHQPNKHYWQVSVISAYHLSFENVRYKDFLNNSNTHNHI